jgi:N-glycosylase/DNA lyase
LLLLFPKMTISRSWASIPITLSNLTLANTLPVGQSFLWHRYPVEHEEASEEFSRAVDDPPRVVRLRQTPTHLLYAAVYPDASAERLDVDYVQTRQWIHDYFQLDHDLDQLYKEWKERDPGLFGKIDIEGRAVGVRLLRQDPWECLLA